MIPDLISWVMDSRVSHLWSPFSWKGILSNLLAVATPNSMESQLPTPKIWVREPSFSYSHLYFHFLFNYSVEPGRQQPATILKILGELLSTVPMYLDTYSYVRNKCVQSVRAWHGTICPQVYPKCARVCPQVCLSCMPRVSLLECAAAHFSLAHCQQKTIISIATCSLRQHTNICNQEQTPSQRSSCFFWAQCFRM